MMEKLRRLERGCRLFQDGEHLLHQIRLLAEQLLDGAAIVHLAVISIVRSWVE